jgi:hypothetical protein
MFTLAGELHILGALGRGWGTLWFCSVVGGKRKTLIVMRTRCLCGRKAPENSMECGFFCTEKCWVSFETEEWSGDCQAQCLLPGHVGRKETDLLPGAHQSPTESPYLGN